jgi:hypothetical protein
MPPEIPGSSAYYAYAQAPAKVRNVAVDFIPEPGCPIGPMAMRCELDCDAFDAPMDARVYLDYKNNSDRPVSAVKFRLRFVDGEQKDRGTFHVLGPAAAPQGVGGVKAKRDITLHPSIVGLKVRVLQVKYGDGTDWTSVKMQELVQPGGASTSSGAAPSLPSAVNSAPMVDEAADMPARQPAAAPYTTGVRGKTYEVAPPGATQSYSSSGSSNGAGAIPPAMTQAAPPAMMQAPPPAMTQAAPPAMTQGVAPTAADIPAAPVVPFYTPPPTPKLGTSPVFNPLNEPDANGVAPQAAVTSPAAPANQPQPQSQSQPQTAAVSQAAPASQSAPASQVQNTQPISAISAPAKTSAAANNVFATSPMAASSSAKAPVQAGQSSTNAFAATAPGATYAPSMHDANLDGPHSFSSSNSFSAPIGNSSTSVNTSPNTSANTGSGTSASTGTNTGILPAATAPTKGVEPINTPWHP